MLPTIIGPKLSSVHSFFPDKKAICDQLGQDFIKENLEQRSECNTGTSVTEEDSCNKTKVMASVKVPNSDMPQSECIKNKESKNFMKDITKEEEITAQNSSQASACLVSPNQHQSLIKSLGKSLFNKVSGFQKC